MRQGRDAPAVVIDRSGGVLRVQLWASHLGADTVLLVDTDYASQSQGVESSKLEAKAYRCAPRTVAAAAGRRRVEVALTFVPPDASAAPVIATIPRAIQIASMVDARPFPDKSLIGENIEQSLSVAVHASAPVTDFTTQSLKASLSAWGVKISDKADLVLTSQIVSLFVKEGNRYEASAAFGFRLQDREGHALWEGTTDGQASAWGRSLSPGNYSEALSEASVAAYAKLLSDLTFQAAWAGRSPIQPSLTPKTNAISAGDLKGKILMLMKEGVAEGVIESYARTHQLAGPLSAEEIVDWKRSGIAESVIKATLNQEKIE